MSFLKIKNYLSLHRLDVALISFFSYLVGSRLAGSFNSLEVVIGLAVSLISFNFIYSFNSWSDWRNDEVNKPSRPIPAGRVKPRQAFIYSMILLALAFAYPIFVYRSSLTLFLFWLLPILGLLYSAKPIYLKKYSFLAILTISLILIIPLLLGYFMNAVDFKLVPFFLILFIFCLTIIPLKDIEDAKGDKKAGIKSLLLVVGQKKLLFFSLIGLTINFCLTILVNLDWPLKPFLLILIAATIGLILIFQFLSLNLKKLYQTIIWLVVLLGMAFFLFLTVSGYFGNFPRFTTLW